MKQSPEFTKDELFWAEKDGAYWIPEFAQLLQDLSEMEHFSHPAENGVARFVADNGTKDLTEKQRKVYHGIISQIPEPDCNRCGNPLEFSEIIESFDNGGLCSYCLHQSQKDD